MISTAQSSPLFIRADASTSIGTGHLMRCLALAQAWQELGGKSVFVIAMDVGGLAERWHAEGIEIVRLETQPGSLDDANQTVALARTRGAQWIVTDGYHFDTNYQRSIKQHDISLLYIDDAGYAGEYAADIILNQNISATEALYVKRPPCSRLLMGPQYALVRREFWNWRGQERANSTHPRKLLVTLGGSDPDNATLTVLRALRLLNNPDLEVRVVIGAANPHVNSLRQEMVQLPFRCDLLVNTNQMPELMAWADLAVAAGGSTCWELALMGLPMLVMILADNQRSIAEGLAVHACAINLGWYNTLNKATLAHTINSLLGDEKCCQKMNRLGSELVDGFGASRVITALKEL